jgi:copper(I)-binding protein
MGSATAMPTDSGTPMMGMRSGTPAMEDSGTSAMSEESSAGGGVSAAYMTLTNRGGAADRLVSVSTDAAGVAEIHTSEMDNEGVMRMRPLTDGLEIPANGSVMMEPGGYHVMLMNLQHDLNAGDSVTLTLTFASGKTLTVEAEIRPPQ